MPAPGGKATMFSHWDSTWMTSVKGNLGETIHLYTVDCSYSYATLTSFSTNYLMTCKVYTDVGGIK